MKFQVFKNGKIAQKCDLKGAYLFGTDAIAIKGAEIKFIDGFIECSRPNLQTAGLMLPWQVEGFGKLLLPTTCLPERERPYNINVEIARAKLMQIINKCEEWLLFNDDSYKNLSNAKQLFIKALQNISDMPASSMFADEALTEATRFSEELAMEHARNAFNERAASRGFSRGCLGCMVDPVRITQPKYMEKLLELFASVVIPINWGKIEQAKGQYNFSELEKCIEILSNKRLTIGAGPLLFFSQSYIPSWLMSGSSSFEKIRENAYKFVTQIVERYRGSIRNWVAVSGLNCQNLFGFSFEQILEMTRAVCMAVKAANPKARKIIEIQNPWGEYYSLESGTIPPLVYIDMVVQSGITFDIFALDMNLNSKNTEINNRDMMHISNLFDSMAPIAKPFWITNVSFSDKVADGNSNSSSSKEKKKRLMEFYEVALSKYFVDSVVYSNLADISVKVPGEGLLDSKLEPKEIFKGFKALRKKIFSSENSLPKDGNAKRTI